MQERSFFCRALFVFLCCLIPSFVKGEDYKYTVSIAAIFRNEASFLKEWIEFHKLVGVDHFYLVNNGSQDAYLSVLAPYIEQGEVELFQWDVVARSWEHWLYEVQAQAYEMVINRATGVTKWLAIIDIDEFLTPTQGKWVPDILKDYEAFGGVGFNWKIFGHSGLLELPKNKLMIESLVMAAPKTRATHLGIKSIVRPERVQGCTHPHYVKYKEGFYHVNANKIANINQDGITDAVYYDRLVINHYWSRSGNDLYQKLLRYSIWFPHIQPDQWLLYVDGMNEVRDHAMDPFIVPLRQKMGLNFIGLPFKKS